MPRHYRGWWLCWFVSLLCIISWQSRRKHSKRKIEILEYDVLVYRATPAGIAAAVAVSKMGKTVVLLEKTAHVGGMATEGGIGMRDGFDYPRLDPRSSQYRWGMLNALHYNSTTGGPIWQPDNWVGEQSFWSLLKESEVEVWLETDIVEGRAGLALDAKQKRITKVQLEDKTWVAAQYVVDASYEGEIMVASGVPWTYGREAYEIYNETMAGVTISSEAQFQVPVYLGRNQTLPKYISTTASDPWQQVGRSDSNVMAYSYRVCLTRNANNSARLTPPNGYIPSDFDLARRYVIAQSKANLSISMPWSNLGYMGYDKILNATTMKFDACCGTSAFGIDAVGLAQDYPVASRAARAKIAGAHRYYVQGLLWFWRTDPFVPRSIRRELANFSLCKDEWPDNGHFPRQLYVREAGRLVGDHVFTQNDRTRKCRHDSIAVGSWGIDIHDVQRVPLTVGNKMIAFNEGLRVYNQGGIFPFDIPYSIILPKQSYVGNLAVVNCPSVSHAAFASIRVEPTLWQLGTAAGTAAALVSNTGISFHDVDIQKLQLALQRQGIPIHWPPYRNCTTSDVPPDDNIGVVEELSKVVHR